MDNSIQKTKIGVYLTPDTIAKVESLYKDDNAESRSIFIERAINFYCGYLTAENYREYFPSVILSTVKGTLDSFENRMAGLLFKMAVELSMMLHVTAANNEIDEDSLTQLQGLCVSEVKRLNGKVSFEDARRFQKG